jgi:hypothetical protein
MAMQNNLGVTDNRYPVLPEDDGTDRPRNPYGDH